MVTEIDPARGLRLQLLDPGDGAACSGWGGALPVRLRELHSHWLCREECAIVLRPVGFQQRNVEWLITYTPAADAARSPAAAPAAGGISSSYDCRRVPPYLRGMHWTTLLSERRGELADRLVLAGGCGISPVLAKLEERDYIHVHERVAASSGGGDKRGGSALAAAGRALGRKRQTKQSTPAANKHKAHPAVLLFELPRFGLTFTLEQGSGQLHSLDYAGYKLCQQQQLVSAPLQPGSCLDSGGEGRGRGPGTARSACSNCLHAGVRTMHA